MVRGAVGRSFVTSYLYFFAAAALAPYDPFMLPAPSTRMHSAMNAFAVVIFFAAAAAPKVARNARQLSSTYIQLDKLTARHLIHSASPLLGQLMN